MLMARGKLADAQHHGEGFASIRALSVLRALPGTSDPTSPGWGSELAADYAGVVASFFASLRNAGAFDTLLPLMRQLPSRTRIIAAVIGPDAGSPGEGAEKLISQVSLQGGQLGLLKAVASVVVSDELARLTGQGGVDFLNAELRGAVASQTDASFIAAIATGATSIASTGNDASAVRADLQAGLAALGLGADSKPHVLASADTALALAFMENSLGDFAFPAMTPQGGEIAGVPVLVTDGTPPGEAETSSLVLVDAASIAADPGTVMLAPANHANVDLGDGQVNLWTNNLTALRAERWFGAEAGRPGAVSVITGVAYGPSDTSP
jgi:HK97 family phage major capsid protein